MNQSQVRRAIRSALQEVARTQKAGGGFVSDSWPAAGSGERFRYHTVFIPAIILGALAGVPGAEQVCARLSTFLKREQSERGTWNYWASAELARTTFSYPDDLDDTACALSALALSGHRLDGAGIARLAAVLQAVQRKPGGPYRTWLVGPRAKAAWRDCDLAVNANVGYLLHLYGAYPRGLVRYLERGLAGEHWGSRYYPTQYPLLYFLSRGYHGSQKARLTERLSALVPLVLQEGTTLEVSLVLSSAVRLGAEEETRRLLIERLLVLRKSGWLAEPFCLDPARPAGQYVAGAPALTAALAAEALTLALAGSARPQSMLNERVLAQVKRAVAAQPAALRAELEAGLERIQLINQATPIFDLAERTRQATGRPLPRSLLVALGVATGWGWLCYTILDDVLDTTCAITKLPAGVWAERAMLDSFRSVLPNPQFQRAVTATLNAMDAANAWEVSATRIASPGPQVRLVRAAIPDYGDYATLAGRSLGHQLAPLAVLYAAGMGNKAGSLQRFFHHFLIARQLNDDAHDWKEDFLRGQLNPVICRLLQGEGRGMVIRRQRELLLKRLTLRFWTHEVEQVCADCEYHLKAAERALARCGFAYPEHLRALLEPLYRAVAEVRAERARAKGFIASYASSHTTNRGRS